MKSFFLDWQAWHLSGPVCLPATRDHLTVLSNFSFLFHSFLFLSLCVDPRCILFMYVHNHLYRPKCMEIIVRNHFVCKFWYWNNILANFCTGSWLCCRTIWLLVVVPGHNMCVIWNRPFRSYSPVQECAKSVRLLIFLWYKIDKVYSFYFCVSVSV